MTRRLIDRFAGGASPRVAWAAVAAFLGLAIANLLLQRRFARLTSGARVLDVQLLASPDSLYATLETYGEPGRAFQVWFALFGQAYALSAYAAAVVLGVWLTRGARTHRARVVYLSLAAAGLAVEWAENAAFVTLLVCYPDRLDVLAWCAIGLTASKFALIAILAVALGIGSLQAVARVVHQRRGFTAAKRKRT